jgi:hypothetical protein
MAIHKPIQSPASDWSSAEQSAFPGTRPSSGVKGVSHAIDGWILFSRTLTLEVRNGSKRDVHCIACGREIRQVVGALPAEELDKALGVQPSSVVRTSSTAGQLAQMFGTGSPLEQTLDSPRAPRPIRRPRIVKQQQPQYRSSTSPRLNPRV